MSELCCKLAGAALLVWILINPGRIAYGRESDSNAADLTRFDALNQRGWNIPHPSVADTLLDDVGGMRSTLADAGVGVYGISINLFEYDLTQSNRGKPRAVNGQVGTWNEAFQAQALTYDLSKLGLKDGQLVLDAFVTVASLQQVNIPDVARITDLSYNQILAGGKIGLEAGYYPNSFRFVGTEVGGSLAAGVLGPQAVIPFEVGLSFPPFGTPAADIKTDLGGGFYNRAGVQRSLAPGGALVERRVNPGAGLRFAPDSTGPLYVDEVGYQKQASTDQASTWVRVGGLYNTTRYPTFTTGHGVENWGLYALADRQLLSSDPAQPDRGLYVGASAMYAPPAQNLFSQYYEARVYDFGPFDARPTDFGSLVVSYETYSKEGQEALAPPAFGAFAQTISAIGSYAFHVRSGFYLQPGLGWTAHASVSRQYDDAFNAFLGITAFF